MNIGDIVYGTITKILPYGAFVVVENENKKYSGLVHISEFSDNYVKKITDYVKVGESCRFKIIEINEELSQLSLSYKLIHKTRGVKCHVPEYKIGFKSLEKELDNWIKNN